MSHTLTTTDDVIQSYGHYKFRVRSVNEYGASEYSEEMIASIAPLPSQLDPVTKDQQFSSDTSIMVRWTASSDTEPILGYKLRMKNESS